VSAFVLHSVDTPDKATIMLDKKYIGHELTRFSVEVEKGRLRFFAKATGQEDPVYTDESAAWDAGYPSLPVPPTFLFCLEMEGPRPAETRELLGIDIARVLHGEQGFVYHAMAFAGDRLSYAGQIVDIYDRKGGALEFLVTETRVTNQHDALVAELRKVTVVRNA
jgi:acyl dehydratase